MLKLSSRYIAFRAQHSIVNVPLAFRTQSAIVVFLTFVLVSNVPGFYMYSKDCAEAEAMKKVSVICFDFQVTLSVTIALNRDSIYTLLEPYGKSISASGSGMAQRTRRHTFLVWSAWKGGVFHQGSVFPLSPIQSRRILLPESAQFSELLLLFCSIAVIAPFVAIATIHSIIVMYKQNVRLT